MVQITDLSCPFNANIGKKETTTKRRAKKIGPTCFADLMIISIRSLFEIFSFLVNIYEHFQPLQ